MPENDDGSKFRHECRNSRWNVAVRPKGSGASVLPGRSRPGTAEKRLQGCTCAGPGSTLAPEPRAQCLNCTVRADPNQVAGRAGSYTDLAGPVTAKLTPPQAPGRG